MSSGARSAGSSPARSSQRISAISAEGWACQAPGAVKTVAWICVAASLAASANQVLQEHQLVCREDDSDFFRQLPGGRLGGRLARLGLAARMHELVRAAFADREEAPGLVEDADGGDHDERVHAQRVHAAVSAIRRNTDVSSWSLAGPVTSHS